MNKLLVKKEVLKKYGLSLREFLLLAYTCANGNWVKDSELLLKKGLLAKSIYNPPEVIGNTDSKELVDTILLESADDIIQKIDYEDIASSIRELYPKGKKPGTTYMWRDSISVISKKLKTLTAKYNCTFTKEQAIKATKAYVESFNGNYTYMQLLKYFILKTFVNANGDTEIKSEFMAYLENEDVVNTTNEDWTLELK